MRLVVVFTVHSGSLATYGRLGNGHYLAVVVDLHARKVVGWSMTDAGPRAGSGRIAHGPLAA